MKCFFTALIYYSKEGEGLRHFKMYADCSQYEKHGALQVHLNEQCPVKLPSVGLLLTQFYFLLSSSWRGQPFNLCLNN